MTRTMSTKKRRMMIPAADESRQTFAKAYRSVLRIKDISIAGRHIPISRPCRTKSPEEREKKKTKNRTGSQLRRSVKSVKRPSTYAVLAARRIFESDAVNDVRRGVAHRLPVLAFLDVLESGFHPLSNLYASK